MTKSKAKLSKFSVDTAGTIPRMSRISGIPSSCPPQPEVWYTPEVATQIEYLVANCAKEVGWFGLVQYHAAEHAYEIYKIVLPNQMVTHTETDIDEKSWAEAGHELIMQGFDTTDMYAWFHSHVNMSVSPSIQDEEQVEEFIESLVNTPEVPVFIRGIVNKKGEYKVDVYYIQHGIAYNCVPVKINDPQRRTFTDGWDVLIKERVKEKTYTAPQTKYYNYNKPVTTFPGVVHHPTNAFLTLKDEEEDFNNDHLIYDHLGNIIGEEEDFDDYDIYEEALQRAFEAGAVDDDEDFEDLVESLMVEIMQERETHEGPNNHVSLSVYGEDWDEHTPIRNRPEGWERDPAYQCTGKYLDHYATIT